MIVNNVVNNKPLLLFIVISLACLNFFFFLMNTKQVVQDSSSIFSLNEVCDVKVLEGKQWPLEGDDAVIFTSFFTQKPDPQRFFKHPVASFHKGMQWYNSITEKNLTATVFVDSVSSYLISEYNKISFYNASKYVGPRSTNDERFFAYYYFLKDHFVTKSVHQHLRQPSYLLLTDLFDVEIVKDPFEFMTQTEESTGRDDLVYLGSEPRNDEWVQDRTTHCNLTGALDLFANRTTMMNAGILGGSFEVVYEFLEHMVYYLKDRPVEENCNNVVFNYVAFKHMENRIVTGSPLHNKFRSNDPTGVYIRHK